MLFALLGVRLLVFVCLFMVVASCCWYGFVDFVFFGFECRVFDLDCGLLGLWRWLCSECVWVCADC